jgi:hypothetical protein
MKLLRFAPLRVTGYAAFLPPGPRQKVKLANIPLLDEQFSGINSG